MDDRSGPERLARLAAFLGGHKFRTELSEDCLTVFSDVGFLTIRCRPREDDGDRWWFFDDIAPLAETDRLVDATVALKGHLRSA